MQSDTRRATRKVARKKGKSLTTDATAKREWRWTPRCLTFQRQTAVKRIRAARGYISRRSLTGLKAPRYSTIHDTLPPNALQLYERDPRYVLACGEGILCCNVPQKNSALTEIANAGARFPVSPAPVSVFPGDYDVNYERRSLKVNASSRALYPREDRSSWISVIKRAPTTKWRYYERGRRERECANVARCV